MTRNQIREAEKKKLARKAMFKALQPLLYAIIAWIVLMGIVHLHYFREHDEQIFVTFTIESAVFLSKIAFLSIESS